MNPMDPCVPLCSDRIVDAGTASLAVTETAPSLTLISMGESFTMTWMD